MGLVRLTGRAGAGASVALKYSARVRAFVALLIIMTGGSVVAWAQTRVALPAAPAATAVADVDASSVRLLVGRSTVLNLGRDIARVSLTSPDVADALVTSPSQLLIHGKVPGTISMFVWDRAGALRRYEVIVERDLARLAEQIEQLFPGEHIAVQSNGKNVVLSGLVSKKDVIEKAVSVAAGYVESREEVVELLQLQPDAPSNQVLLRVRFAEVSRNALTELGASFFTSPTGVVNNVARVGTQQFAAPGFDALQIEKESFDWGAPVTAASGEFTFSDFLNFFLFNQKYDLGVAVRALKQRGLFQSLAEPNLVAESGKEASFLAGGEFPIPVVQGGGANLGISVVFKEFGIRLNFTPTVTEGGRVHLKVRPEVSTLDFANGIVLQGFRIPALSTRRTETELELMDGQTFAIAGLLTNTVATTLSKVPGIGDIPILGYLFKSKAAQKNQTELVVLITPQILPNNSRGVTTELPPMEEPYLEPPAPDKTVETPPPAFTRARPVDAPAASRVAGTAAVAPVASARPSQPTSDAAQAAAAVVALTPSGPRLNETVVAPTMLDSTGPVAEPVVPVQPRALTKDEQKALDQALREERKRAEQEAKAAERAQAESRKREAAEEKARVKAEKAEQKARAKAEKQEEERQERLAKEQARREAEAAKQSREQARRLAEEERQRQKAMAEAEARLEAAEADYQKELAQRGGR